MNPDARLLLSTRARRPLEPAEAFWARAAGLGFDGILVDVPLGRALGDLAQVHALSPPARAHTPAVAVTRPDEAFSLVSADTAVRRRTVETIAAIGQAALAAGCRRVIVTGGAAPAFTATSSPPRTTSSNAELDRLCRSLYALARALPALELSLAASEAPESLPRPGDLEFVRADLGRRAPGYWHDTAATTLAATRDGYDPEVWLAAAGASLTGVTLGDTDGRETGLPLGIGLVRTAGLAGVVGALLPVALAIEHGAGPQALDLARSEALRVLGR